ncbi:MAG: hypothetical protein IPP05_16395 [Cytophagaceae bacterium]|nr:hypothetical protein [Cytophagaceae bacterium]
MKHRSIEDIVYIIENAKKNNLPKPIILIGAGVSITAGIPGTNSIVEKILEDFSEKPSIRNLDEAGKKDYYTLMDALSADERRGIFSFYNNHDRVKINLSHIYLAQLLIEDYVDFVFTPNFDDLLIKACALFNKIPPIYDLSNLNDFTTTDFQKGSITYLHGQHHGQWLLNAKGELAKTKDILPKLFNRVCNKRTWIIVGYSGSDEILDEISKFESFDNDLYWVTNKNTEPIEKVKQNLLDVELKNAFTVSGYDSDAFFLELHSGLNLETPQIFNKPFSFIKTMMLKIKDIEEYGREEKYLEKFVFLGERLDKSKEMVEKAILILENEPVNKLEQEILEAIAKNDFSKAEEFLKKSKVLNAIILNEPIANLYHNWGNHFYQLGKEKDLKMNILNR